MRRTQPDPPSATHKGVHWTKKRVSLAALSHPRFWHADSPMHRKDVCEKWAWDKAGRQITQSLPHEPKCAEDVGQMCRGCRPNVPRMWANCAEDVGRMCRGCGQKCAEDVGQNVPRVWAKMCRGCGAKCAEGVGQNVPRVWAKYAEDVGQNVPRMWAKMC